MAQFIKGFWYIWDFNPGIWDIKVFWDIGYSFRGNISFGILGINLFFGCGIWPTQLNIELLEIAENYRNEPPLDKTNKKTAPTEDSYQPDPSFLHAESKD